MAVTLVNPKGLPQPEVYRQLSIATGSRLVFLAVRSPRRRRPQVGEGDLAAQVEQAYLNIGTRTGRGRWDPSTTWRS
ncbi:hypothetical protein [Nonomuraea roseola]|uniref:hypothetical protein n=1 Tax=Nonomuraea roseola TaxID=46179 RepID=UPI0031FA37CE